MFHVEDDLNPSDDGFADSSRLLSPLEASQLLTDEYSAKILLATYKRKISAQEISQRYGIPIAACYRKIRILEEVGLIQCVERILTQNEGRQVIRNDRLQGAPALQGPRESHAAMAGVGVHVGEQKKHMVDRPTRIIARGDRPGEGETEEFTIYLSDAHGCRRSLGIRIALMLPSLF